MKKVLIISYYFPPDGEIGGIRIEGLAKYLPYFNWDPIILTKKLPSSLNPAYNVIQTDSKDGGILSFLKKRYGSNPIQNIKRSIGISKHKNRKSLRYRFLVYGSELVSYPDFYHYWYKEAILKAHEIFKEETIDILISSSLPITTHLIANNLKHEYKVPWIADQRDLWSQNHYRNYSYARRFLDKRLEIKTLSKADALTTISNNMANSVNTLHKNSRVYSIPNGYDPQSILHDGVLNTKFSLTYTGSLYQGKRDPSLLFEALNELVSEEKIKLDDIEVSFYGPEEDWLISDIEKYNLKGTVNYYGSVPRNNVLEKQRKSQLLLLFLWDNPNEVGVCPGKIYEYLAAKRPILAVGGPKGVVSDLLEKTNAGEHVNEIKDLKNIIEHCYEEYILKGQVCYRGKELEVAKYSQIEMARKFSQVLNSTIAIKK